METQPYYGNKVTAEVPFHQSFIWSAAALAADMAEESLRAAITAAPRFWTVWWDSKTQIVESKSFLKLIEKKIAHWNEVSIQPRLIVDCIFNRFCFAICSDNCGVRNIWKLSRGMVSPDCDFANIVNRNS